MKQKEYLKKLHEVEVEILDDIDKICKKYNINYFLCGGTLLGAIRHKGFIPWDDDIDIGMTREDYDKFKKICLDEKALPDKYFLHTYETDDTYWLPFMKVRKNNTTFNEKYVRNLNNHKGIFVDIFPFDNINMDGGFLNKVRAWRVLNINDAINCKIKLRSIESCKRKLVIRFLMLFSFVHLRKKQEKLLKAQSKKNTNYVVCFIGGLNPFKEFVPKDKLFPLRKVEFEGKKYPTMKDYDYYLSRTYGDYMTLPPENERITHMPVNVSFTEGKNIKTRRIK